MCKDALHPNINIKTITIMGNFTELTKNELSSVNGGWSWPGVRQGVVGIVSGIINRDWEGFAGSFVDTLEAMFKR